MITYRKERPYLISVTSVGDTANNPLIELEDAKRFLNVVTTDDDLLIRDLVLSATRILETRTRRSFINKTVVTRYKSRAFPVVIPRGPVQSITSVKTIEDGTPTTQTLTDFYLVGGGGSLRPKVSLKSDKSVDDDFSEIEIETVNGFGATAASVPEDLKAGARKLVAYLYDRRDDDFSGGKLSAANIDLPWSIESVVVAYQVPII